jgi:hypothetical protein
VSSTDGCCQGPWVLVRSVDVVDEDLFQAISTIAFTETTILSIGHSTLD